MILPWWPYGRCEGFVVRYCVRANTRMTETLSIRLDSETKKRLEALSKRSKRSKSLLAAEAITAYVETEEWQLAEIHAGIAEMEEDAGVSHDKVTKWLKTWGTSRETKPPR
jgi:RHH-type transcriptional regulator, rel operon repressor / antitoxin RelB